MQRGHARAVLPDNRPHVAASSGTAHGAWKSAPSSKQLPCLFPQHGPGRSTSAGSRSPLGSRISWSAPEVSSSRTDPLRRLPLHQHRPSRGRRPTSIRATTSATGPMTSGDLLRRVRPARDRVARDEPLGHLRGAARLGCAARRVRRAEGLGVPVSAARAYTEAVCDGPSGHRRLRRG